MLLVAYIWRAATLKLLTRFNANAVFSCLYIGGGRERFYNERPARYSVCVQWKPCYNPDMPEGGMQKSVTSWGVEPSTF
jgi:hypothetical protein